MLFSYSYFNKMTWVFSSILFFCKITEWHYGVHGARYVTKAPEAFVRSTRYDPKVIDKTCLLKPEMGPCRANIPMYYFKPSSMNCSTFSWGGCQGNGNRFDSEKECELSCLARPNQKPQRKKWCSLRFDYGYCFGAVYRWYYDPMWKVCKNTIYSGCGGNKNNFYSQDECEQTCRFANGGQWAGNSNKKNGIYKVLYINHPAATTRKTQPTTTQTVGVKWSKGVKCFINNTEVPCNNSVTISLSNNQ